MSTKLKISELKEMKAKELEELLEKKQNDLRRFSFEISKNKIKNVKEAKEIRKDIARILTFFNSNNFKK